MSRELRQRLLDCVLHPQYRPLGAKAVFKALGLSPREHLAAQGVLEQLVQEGVLHLKRKQYHLVRPPLEVVSGVIRMHPKGFGFVEPHEKCGYPHDVFIPRHLTALSVDGDTVEVEIDPNSNWSKGPEGKVVAILERSRTHVGGIIHHIESPMKARVYSPLLGSSKMISVPPRKQSSVGDRVIITIVSWGDEETPPRGEIAHYIGSIDDPSCDIAAAVEEFDLRSTFPPEVVQAAHEWGQEVPQKEWKRRKDLTQSTTITIDPETAKDFDDALSLTRDAQGGFHLGVHIADVAHYVPAGSLLDTEARERGNSVYFPGFCLPMLPHELSDHLCSLKPHVPRLTVSVLMHFDRQGHLLSSEIVRGVIQSAHRFSYEEAKEVLDGKLKSPHAPLLKQMVELCHLLKERRYERGSIDFSLPDLHITVDEKGHPQHVRRIEYDITHQCVEEYMLKANEVVARHLSKQGKKAVFRTHETPAPADMEEFYGMARTLGFSLPQHPTQQDLQELFSKARTTPHAHQLSVGFIRSMKLAYYSTDNVGHYGLALDYYCHFTSPIRRYTDLVTQRLLFNEEAPDIDTEKVANHCSQRERIAFKAESSIKLLKKFRLLRRWMQEDPHAIYSATVTRVKPFGLYFELPQLMLEGFLHISELENDYFVFNPRQDTLFGRATGKVHRVGESIDVRPTTIDLALLEGRWELVTSQQRERKKPRKRRA